ncbi:unnamed protein product [Arctia plantaginis]|uniref:C2H2-type domain-containing protein n=1 Tax=Arctia plantaginis TaxID=874455 RepID=A0A8S1BNR4_ARCPL|nr:unnamed protein product [Arctia plantaginis]
MYKLTQECKILFKIRTCLSFSLTINEGLPNTICEECVNKIDQINEFCIKVKENEQTLKHHVQNGTLENYYQHLKNGISIKHEDKSFGETTDIINHSELLPFKGNGDNKFTKNIKVEESTNNDIDIPINNSTDDEDDTGASNLFIHSEGSANLVKNITNEREVTECTPMLTKDSAKAVLDRYSCLTCSKICQTHDELREHYNKEHTNKDNKITEPTYTKTIINGKIMYKCDVCCKMYSKKYLKRHLLHHTDVRPYVCKLCSRTYTTVSDIMRHGFRVHSGIKMLCAYKCGFSSAYTGALKEHEDRVHKNTYKYTCDKCGKGFQVKTWYDQHQNIHTGLKPFVCDICGHAFHMEKNLTTHRWKIHPQSDAKRLTCVHCNLKCESENTLNTHLETEHGVTRKKPDRRKKALCDLCGKILNRPEALVLHRRMHLGQKPYKCSICNKLFARKFSMQVHERSHSRVNSHECVHCGKRYSQQSALYRHQRQQHQSD